MLEPVRDVRYPVALGVDGTEVFIRQIGSKFTLSVDSKGPIFTGVKDVELTKEQFDKISPILFNLTGSAAAVVPQEIERKWLVSELPDLRGAKAKDISQGYIAITGDGSEVRIREKGGDYFLTIKSDGGKVRAEVEVRLTGNQYLELLPTTQDRNLTKTRHELVSAGLTLELDIFSGRHTGLRLVEVEFSSDKASNQFVSPAWFGKEVTEDKAFKNKKLALDGLPGSF